MTAALLGALSWEPQIKGALYVLLAVAILVGSACLLLSTNMGARLGFQLTAAGLFGLLTTIGLVWWVNASGPVGVSPSWTPVETIVGSASTSRQEAMIGFPEGWRHLEPTDPEVADAQPVVDGEVVAEPGERGGVFSASSDYLVIAAFQRGGESHGPFGIKARPFNLFHKPSYLVVQVQHVIEVTPGPGEAVAAPAPDPSAPVVNVLLLRDLGSERLNPAVFTISSGLIFGLFVYQLHVNDKAAVRRREEEGATTSS